MKATGYKHLNHKQRSIVESYLNKDAKLMSIAKEIKKMNELFQKKSRNIDIFMCDRMLKTSVVFKTHAVQPNYVHYAFLENANIVR